MLTLPETVAMIDTVSKSIPNFSQPATIKHRIHLHHTVITPTEHLVLASYICSAVAFFGDL